MRHLPASASPSLLATAPIECRAIAYPALDAGANASTLRDVGFEVIEGSNLTYERMTEKLLDSGLSTDKDRPELVADGITACLPQRRC